MSVDTNSKPNKNDPGDHGHGRTVTVTIIAPNNDSRTMEVDLHERVSKAAREAVDILAAAHLMEETPSHLVLLNDQGGGRQLDDVARLDESGVQAGSRLAVKPKKPKTDG